MPIRVVLAASLAGLCAAGAGAQEKRSVPEYTNDDLDRVSVSRGQTGVFSTSAARPAEEKPRPQSAAGGRGEEYWRREAERVREKVEALREKARALEERIAERRRRPGVQPYSDPRVRSLQARLEGVRERVRELESDLEDRARRERALPGWIR